MSRLLKWQLANKFTYKWRSKCQRPKANISVKWWYFFLSYFQLTSFHAEWAMEPACTRCSGQVQIRVDRLNNKATCRRPTSLSEVLWLLVSVWHVLAVQLKPHQGVEERRAKKRTDSLWMLVVVLKGGAEGVLTFLPIGPSAPTSPTGPGKPWSCRDSYTSKCYKGDMKTFKITKVLSKMKTSNRLI